MVTKLLCIYSEGYPFFGVNINSQKNFGAILFLKQPQGGPYLQNHKIIELLSKNLSWVGAIEIRNYAFEYS